MAEYNTPFTNIIHPKTGLPAITKQIPAIIPIIAMAL